ncbi:YggS family pyridoxal phosphate-dependent enzyme [bacterium]|nr:YggS family pyridoxal phosphate-dependent enzyme [bacterium]
MNGSSAEERYRALRAQLRPGVGLIAVSKTRTAAEIMELYALGQRDFGENRVQELIAKAEQLPKDIRWHLIGQLQTNKVRAVLPYVHLIHSVDREKLLDVLEAEAHRLGKKVDVLLERHIASEESKAGLDAAELEAMFTGFEAGRYPSLRLKGLMGMASFTDNEAQIRAEFSGLKREFDQGVERGLGWTELSMGMSSDYLLAMECGSTLIRVGTALFGPRAQPQ